MNPSNTIFDVKRIIGRRYTDLIAQGDMKLWPFSVCSLKYDIPMIEVSYKGEQKYFTPEEISAMVLVKMKKTAESYLDSEVKSAVITVPVYFNDSQRQATKDAGLNVVRIINEPTAAAIAYGLHKKEGDYNVTAKKVIVFDLGGGTLDVSLVTVDNDSLEVNAISGDNHIGGGDFDNNLVCHFVAEFKRKHKKDISGNPKALARLRASCEKAKRILSSATETAVEIDSLFEGIDLSSPISRARFEMLNMELFLACMKPIQTCLWDAEMDKSDIAEVVLVGGSTRIPEVQELLQEFFGGKELSKLLNTDEVVACGAAICAAFFSLELEVTPMSLGIEVQNDDFSIVMPRNTHIPRKMERRFTTVYDNQTVVCIRVYEGKSKGPNKNFFGEFRLFGITPAPKHVPKITVSFSIDANGILTVTAEEKMTRNKNQITITKHSGRQSKGEIAMVVKDAKKYLECYVNDVQKFLREYGKEMQAEDKEVITVTVGRAIEWLDKNLHLEEAAKFQRKLDKLQSICQPLMGFRINSNTLEK